MGEIFLKRIFLVLFFLFASFSFSVSCSAEVHNLYSNFSSAENGFIFNNASNIVSVLDKIIYNTGYYSVNSSPWASFTFSGTAYNNNENWLHNFTSMNLPDFGEGEHYIIIYSCSYANSSWNCHDNKWQLTVVNNTINNIINNTNNSTNNTTNNTTSCNDTCVGLGYQCGVHTVCNVSTNCGGCSAGYNCTNGICAAVPPASCGIGQNCLAGEYCFNGVCLKNVSGNTYFVSVNGNDSHAGNFTHPWGTWQKAFNNAEAGDIVYFRGGVWYPQTEVVYDGGALGNSGTESEHIIYENYPGETPILDLSLYTYTISMSGLAINYVTNIEFRGLTVRNNKQRAPGEWINGLQFSQCGNLWVDRVTSYGHGGYGIWIMGYDKLYLTNSDSYDNADPIATDPGNRADGFSLSVTQRNNTYTYISGCRAWNNSDDGFEISSLGELEVTNCWSFGNGRLEYGSGTSYHLAYSFETDPNKRRMHNNLAVFDKGDAFTENNLLNALIGPVMDYSNNLVYRTSMGFTSSPSAVFNCATGYANVTFHNNLVYQNTYGVVNGNYPSYFDQVYLAACNYGSPIYATYYNNTWISRAQSPYWRYNPGVTVTDSDFVLLPSSKEDCVAILSASRKSDGSLPDIGNYFHLAPGSDLIDAGVDIGLPYSGSAPDIGAFEYS